MITSVVFLIEQISRGLYLLCAVGVVLNVRTLLLTRGELMGAEFELERELAARRQAGALTWTLGLVEVILAIYAVAHVIAPTLRSDLAPGNVASPVESAIFVTGAPGQVTAVNDQGTPLSDAAQGDLFQTLTAQPAGTSNAPILVTLIASPTPVGTIEPGPTPPVVGCTDDQARLQVPANNQDVFESLTVIGSAQTANFTHYRFEVSGPSTGGSFAPYGGDKTTAVKSIGVLGQISMAPFAFGTYQFKLAVFDHTDFIKASCTVTIYIRARPPTPTPIPTAANTTPQH